MKGIRIFVSTAKNLIIKNIPSKSGITFILFLAVCSIAFSNTEPASGRASYYANKFQGKNTASGEKYDKNKFTAAHRTYPFGTKLKVTNKKTGSWVQVYVNDRGPYSKDRIIDLSYAAALEIGMIQMGVIEVTIEPITNVIELPPPVVKEKESGSSAQAGYYSSKLEHIKRPKGYLLQVGAFSSYEQAMELINTLKAYSVGVACIEIAVVRKKRLYRVLYAGFQTRQKITSEQKALKKRGFDSIVISPR